MLNIGVHGVLFFGINNIAIEVNYQGLLDVFTVYSSSIINVISVILANLDSQSQHYISFSQLYQPHHTFTISIFSKKNQTMAQLSLKSLAMTLCQIIILQLIVLYTRIL